MEHSAEKDVRIEHFPEPCAVGGHGPVWCAECMERWPCSSSVPRAESCLCRDPLREVHAGCSIHGHSPERVLPPAERGHDGHTIDVGYVHTLTDDGACRPDCPHPSHTLPPGVQS